jgi:hypothetical protein
MSLLLALTGAANKINVSWLEIESASGVTHDTSGALLGQGSAISGSANHAALHTTTGTLVGQGSAIAGSAARVGGATTHATSGALVGPGSAVSGSANRFRQFASSGVLTGQGSALSGTANHAALHTTTGTLTGQGSVINGTAARLGAAVTHDTSGVLVGQGSLINGSAQNGTLVQDTHDGFWANEWDKIRKREKRKYLQSLEVIEDQIIEVEAQIEEVKQAKPTQKVRKAERFNEPDFYAGQIQLVQQLIAERARLIDMEDEEILLLL